AICSASAPSVPWRRAWPKRCTRAPGSPTPCANSRRNHATLGARRFAPAAVVERAFHAAVVARRGGHRRAARALDSARARSLVLDLIRRAGRSRRASPNDRAHGWTAPLLRRPREADDAAARNANGGYRLRWTIASEGCKQRACGYRLVVSESRARGWAPGAVSNRTVGAFSASARRDTPNHSVCCRHRRRSLSR